MSKHKRVSISPADRQACILAVKGSFDKWVRRRNELAGAAIPLNMSIFGLKAILINEFMDERPVGIRDFKINPVIRDSIDAFRAHYSDLDLEYVTGDNEHGPEVRWHRASLQMRQEARILRDLVHHRPEATAFRPRHGAVCQAISFCPSRGA